MSKQADSDGLVWNNNEIGEQSTTHALVVGVGRFNPKAGVLGVNSPCASAVMLAQWFLAGTKGETYGFRNQARPLGSLAVLLSDPLLQGKATFADVIVPSCSFAELHAAVAGWVKRASANPANAMILYMASHGASAGRRSGIICEDFRQDGSVDTGMFDIEQFAKALGHVKTENKLLIFDCCRTEIGELDEDETLGQKLFTPQDSRAIPDRPFILYSTAPGAASYGRDDGRTLFGDALADALKGLATSQNERWKIGTYNLARIAGRILSAQRQESVELQRPDVANPRDFTISVVEPVETVTAVARVDLATAGEGWTLQAQAGGKVVADAEPAWEGAAFTRITLPGEGEYTFVLKASDGSSVWSEIIPLDPPGACLDIPDPEAITVKRAKSVDATLIADEKADMGTILLPASNLDIGFLTIKSLQPNEAGEGATFAPNLARRLRAPGLDINSLAVGGRYQVGYTRVDGTRFDQMLEVAPGDTVTLGMPTVASPHEWLREAIAAGLVTSREAHPPGAKLVMSVPITVSAEDARRLAAGERDLEPAGLDDVHLHQWGRDETRQVFEVLDDVETRWNEHMPARPPWLVSTFASTVERPARRELAFLPTLGGVARHEQEWRAMVLAAGTAADGSATASFVDNANWGALLAFLGRRDFPSSLEVLRTKINPYEIEAAVFFKRSNPLAAAAGALVAIACGDPKDFRIPDNWLTNLAGWFPDLPDGPVILGRRLWMMGEREAARGNFRKALERGIPAFSLSVDWLAEGLESLDPEHAAEALKWSGRVDPKRAFTTLRLAG